MYWYSWNRVHACHRSICPLVIMYLNLDPCPPPHNVRRWKPRLQLRKGLKILQPLNCLPPCGHLPYHIKSCRRQFQSPETALGRSHPYYAAAHSSSPLCCHRLIGALTVHDSHFQWKMVPIAFAASLIGQSTGQILYRLLIFAALLQLRSAHVSTLLTSMLGYHQRE